MRREILTATVVVLFLAASAAAAQERQMGTMPAQPEFEVFSEDGTVTIPFELVNNHLIIPLSVNGSKFNVILDTGMPMSGLLLWGTEDVEKLGLDYGPMKARLGGAGSEGQPLEASIATGATVRLEDARMTNATVIVPPPMPGLIWYHDGIIGAALFSNFVVDINYDERQIRLYDPATYKPSDGAVALPLTLVRRIPFAEVQVTLADGRKVPLTVAVDLGASHAVSLNVDSTDTIAVPDNAIRTIIGKGVGGNVHGQVGRIPELDLGGFALTDVVATFPVSEHQNPGGMDSKNGNLGSGVLKRFNVTFDYAGKRMLLVPNQQFKAPFEWNMSGMRLEPGDDEGLRIEFLIANSPAMRAGLAVGDVVTHVNGRPVSMKNLVELRELMLQDGAALEITAMRDGTPLEVKLRLRRIV